MMLREIMGIYCDSHTKHTNKLCGQNTVFLMLNLAVHTVTTMVQNVNLLQKQTHLF
jgi:hypothetical protein